MSLKFCLPEDISEIVTGLGTTASAFEGKRILLAGGRGFLGRYFTETFRLLNHSLKSPCQVTVLDNYITAGELGETEVSDQNITSQRHDVTHPFYSEQKFDFILHAAGIASPYYYRAHPLETLEVAVSGTRNMLELAKEHNAKFLFFSSSEIYGDPDPRYVPTPESYRGNVSCLGPRACYDESKRVGETLCRVYFTQFGTQTRMVRPFNVYGPGMQEKDYRVLPNFASRIVSGKPLRVYGTGNQTRTFCYITDAIVGFLQVLVHGVSGEPYNIGNPRNEVSMKRLVELVSEVVDSRVDLDLVDYPDSYPADEPNRRCPDIIKANRQVNYEPKVEIREGLSRFFNWALRNYKGEERVLQPEIRAHRGRPLGANLS